jgi:LPS biosynthesis protein
MFLGGEMIESEYINKIHNEILEIMDIIDQICQKNHIQYYLISGTLLGAVRHGGFIPWDDDLDIAMPREDFNYFIKICETELPTGYRLRWITTQQDYWRLYAKVSNENTLFIEQDVDRKCGIFVDIFPLDDCNGYNVFLEFRKKIIVKLAVMISWKQKDNVFKGIKRLVVRTFSYKMLFSLAERIMRLTNGDTKKYYTNFSSQYPIKKRTNYKKYFGKGKYIPFENRFYLAPNDVHAVLQKIFGANYMQLPPVNKRKTHYPKYVKFSDGEEIYFEDAENKLKIEDIL